MPKGVAVKRMMVPAISRQYFCFTSYGTAPALDRAPCRYISLMGSPRLRPHRRRTGTVRFLVLGLVHGPPTLGSGRRRTTSPRAATGRLQRAAQPPASDTVNLRTSRTGPTVTIAEHAECVKKYSTFLMNNVKVSSVASKKTRGCGALCRAPWVWRSHRETGERVCV